MSRKKRTAPTAPPDKAKVLHAPAVHGDDPDKGLARLGLDPVANAMSTARAFGKGSFGDLSVTGLFEVLQEQVAAVHTGDLSGQRAMLATQALALNSIFTEMARRSAANMGESIVASERYMRLALKAQAQSRATIEALERLVGGREQIVKHIHVDNRGGQAVVADTVQTGGRGLLKDDEQSHATAATRPSVALPGPDPFGNGVPVPGTKGEAALQDARRHEPRST